MRAVGGFQVRRRVMKVIFRAVGSNATPGRRAMMWAVAALLAGSMLAGACGGDSHEAAPTTTAGDRTVAVPTPTRTVTPGGLDGGSTPLPAPTSEEEGGATEAEAVVCAADSTQQFRDVDAEAPWSVYCPVYLPDGFQLESIEYSLDLAGAAPSAGKGALEARFEDSATGARVNLVQGLPGLSALTSGIRDGHQLGRVSYGDLPANLFTADPAAPDAPYLAVLATSSPDGVTHWLQTIGLSEDDTRSIAGQMARVDALP
jgi:hypothetical protein